MALQGTVHFPGIPPFISASMTRTHGISPSMCMLRTQAQPIVNSLPGILVLAFGNTRLVFPEAVAGQATFDVTRGGYFWNLPILDRRWKWRYGQLSGRFNVRRPNGTIQPSTRLNAQRLARYILDEMGEAQPSIQGLPSDQFPEVSWDRANPAEELQELCDQYGCRIILGLDNRVKIRRLGGGALLPLDGEDINVSVEFQGGALPRTLEVVCGPTLYESKLSLRAVCLDIDGEIRPISESQINDRLRAKGSNVFLEDPNSFGNLIGETYVDPNDQKLKRLDHLALRTCFRWYQVYKQSWAAEGAKTQFDPPRWSNASVESIRQLLPINSHRATKVSDVNADVENSRVDIDAFLPPRVEGKFLRFHAVDWVTNPPEDEYDLGFDIDERNGIVRFGEPVLNISDEAFIEPDLVLLTSYSVRRTEDGAFDRYTVDRGFFRQGGGILTIPRPDMVVRHITEFNGRVITGTKDNVPEIRQEAQKHLLQVGQSLVPQPSGNILYRGLRPLDLDGAVHQITYTIGESGTFTQISRNSEHSVNVIPYKEKRAIEKSRRVDRREKYKRKLTQEESDQILERLGGGFF